MKVELKTFDPNTPKTQLRDINFLPAFEDNIMCSALIQILRWLFNSMIPIMPQEFVFLTGLYGLQILAPSRLELDEWHT